MVDNLTNNLSHVLQSAVSFSQQSVLSQLYSQVLFCFVLCCATVKPALVLRALCFVAS